jgi:hypothetical protein
MEKNATLLEKKSCHPPKKFTKVTYFLSHKV